MESRNIYNDIAKRTKGSIYIGVVGPVRTGKSTFIKRFMESLVLPNIGNEYDKARSIDELPQSASGKTVMTTEPKFVPNEAVEVKLDASTTFKVRLIDCVGYIVDGALGYIEENAPRMVSTPWFPEPIPFKHGGGDRNQKSHHRAFDHRDNGDDRRHHLRHPPFRLRAGGAASDRGAQKRGEALYHPSQLRGAGSSGYLEASRRAFGKIRCFHCRRQLPRHGYGRHQGSHRNAFV